MFCILKGKIMYKKHNTYYQILSVFPLLLSITACSNWNYNHDGSSPLENINNTEESNSNKRWDTQGFTLEEYKIYTKAGMNNKENDPNSALPWKKAGIPAEQAIKAHQEWIAADIDNDKALYFTKRNISLSQYQETSKSLDDANLDHSNDNVVSIIQKTRNGMTVSEAIQQLKQQQEEERQKEVEKQIASEKRYWGEENYKMCNGSPHEMPNDFIVSINPYNVVGKCYYLPYPIFPLQWISRNQILNQLPPNVLANSPFSPLNSIYYIESNEDINEEINSGSRTAVIGIEPKTYTTAIGAINTVPSFRIINRHRAE